MLSQTSPISAAHFIQSGEKEIKHHVLGCQQGSDGHALRSRTACTLASPTKLQPPWIKAMATCSGVPHRIYVFMAFFFFLIGKAKNRFLLWASESSWASRGPAHAQAHLSLCTVFSADLRQTNEISCTYKVLKWMTCARSEYSSYREKTKDNSAREADIPPASDEWHCSHPANPHRQQGQQTCS